VRLPSILVLRVSRLGAPYRLQAELRAEFKGDPLDPPAHCVLYLLRGRALTEALVETLVELLVEFCRALCKLW